MTASQCHVNTITTTGSYSKAIPSGAWKYATCFLLGLIVTKCTESSFTDVQTLSRMLQSSGKKMLGLQMNTTRFAEELEELSNVDKNANELDETLLAAHTSEESRSAPLAPPLTDPSAFQAIVDTASERVTNDAEYPNLQTSRNYLDVAWWENQPGLSTRGGLNSQDRHLLGLIYRNASSVFEYGLGESTYIANHVGVPRYAGIDSDPLWIAKARDKVAPHFRFYLGDIGATGDWGFPKNPKLEKSIFQYQLSPLIVEPKPFDVYMVDGRWRVPCLLASFLHASARGALPGNVHVLLHDCELPGSTRGRIEYHRANHLLQMVAHSGNKLCVYQRRPETTDQQLQELWHEYRDQIMR